MSWERIQQLSDMLNFPKTSIDSVMLFTLEREFFDIFISLQSFTDEPNMLDITRKIQTLFQDAVLDLSPLYLTEYFDFLRMRIKPIQPCIRKIYVDVLLSLKSTIQSGWYPNIRNEDAVDREGGFSETILHNLVEVPTNSNSSKRVALEDHLEILQKMLNLLRANIFRVPIKDLEFLLRDIEIVAIDVGLLVYSLYEDEEEKEDMAPGGVNITQVLDLSSNIQRLSIDIYLTIRKAIQSNLLRIHGLGYVDCLLNNLKKIQILHSDSLASVMDKLQLLQMEFENLQPFLQVVAEEQQNDLDKIQHCATQLIGKAHEIEYIVDACIGKKAPELPSCWLVT